MASASPALIVSNPRASGFTSSSSVSSMPFTIGNLSQTVVLSRNFHGLRRRRRSEPFYASPSIWASRVPRRSFIANAISEALQYVQENPDEVCPAGWKPGEKSMKPDPKLST